MSLLSQTTRRRKSRRATCKYSGMENDVYPVYCEDDASKVHPILEYFQQQGLQVYVPMVEGPPNEAEIKIWTERGVYNAKKTVVFLTKNFLSSTECEFQASHAVDRFSRTKGINKHRVVVIVLESCKVPKYLRHFKCVYAWKYRDSPDDKLWEIYTKVTEAPKCRYKRGHMFIYNTWASSHPKPCLEEKRKGCSTTLTQKHEKLMRYHDLLWNIAQVKHVLEHSELHCVEDGCSFRCKGADFKTFYVHSINCGRQKVQCRNCGQHMLKRNQSRHEQERCKHKEVFCKNEGCNRKLSRQESKVHERICPFQEVSCDNSRCDHVFAKKDRAKHMEICNFVIMSCKGCNMNYLRRDIYNHRCPNALPVHMQPQTPEREMRSYLRTETYKCPHPNCPFSGSYSEYNDHCLVCDYKISQCPDCGARKPKRQLEWHKKECDRIVECEKCHMQVPSSAKLTHDRYICTGNNTVSFCSICHTFIGKEDHSRVCQYDMSTEPSGAAAASLISADTDHRGPAGSLSRPSRCPQMSIPNSNENSTRPIPVPLILTKRSSTVTPEQLLMSVHDVFLPSDTSDYAVSSPGYTDPRRLPLAKVTPESRRRFNKIMDIVDKNPSSFKQLFNTGHCNRDSDGRSICQQSEYYSP